MIFKITTHKGHEDPWLVLREHSEISEIVGFNRWCVAYSGNEHWLQHECHGC